MAEGSEQGPVLNGQRREGDPGSERGSGPDVREAQANLTPYFGNPLAAYGIGIDVDFRVKLAMELMKCDRQMSPRGALDAATELFALAEERGMVRPLMTGDDIPDDLRHQLIREVRAQVHQQANAERVKQEEAPKLQHPATFHDRRRQ